jgi:hypothetical protein
LRYQLIQPRQANLSAVEQVLFNRGINPNELENFKYPTDEHLNDPTQLKHMFDGAQMLVKHVSQNDKIFI